MSEAGASPVDDLLGEPDPKQFTPKPPRTLLFGVVAIVVILVAVAALVALGLQAKERQFRGDLERRLDILAASRAELVKTWLDGTIQLGNRVAQSDFIRLFAHDVNQGPTGLNPTPIPTPAPAPAEAPDQPSVVEQIPLMTNVLSEFVANTSLFAGFLLDRQGKVVLTTDSATSVTLAQKALGVAVVTGGTPVFGPVRLSSRGLALDLAMPIFPPQIDVTEASTPVPVEAVLVLVIPAGSHIAGFLKPFALAEPWERSRLVQKGPDGFEEMLPGTAPPFHPVTFVPEGDSRQAMTEGPSLNGSERVYSVVARVPGLNWWVVQEAGAEQAYADVSAYNRTAFGGVGLVVIVVMVSLGAFWWRLVSGHNQRLALLFRAMARQYNAQKRFLDSINNTIVDLISLKDLDGTYRYVNPAFARAVKRPLEKIPGLDDAALFGQGTAERLRLSDQQALSSDRPVTLDERLFLESRLHYMQMTKIRFRGADDTIQGIVTVGRDVTELVEEQEKRELAIKQMVLALVHAIELRDPYLAGHSQLVAGFATAVARHLQATPSQVATVEIAASLCQIGKLSISRSLLNKPGRLSPEEVRTIQGHVEHTAAVLRDIDFGLPVFEAIYQMNERLDGGGYPRGLAGDQIMLEARILGVCDVFCARVSPRSYRPAITADEALDILAGNITRYDRRVLESLRAVVGSVDGELLLRGIRGGDPSPLGTIARSS